jgi:4-hydroxy-tetrahydrodipicolinate reductase
MGRTIERLALEMGHSIVARLDNDKDWEDQMEAVGSADAAIEFSLPHVAVENIYRCFALDIPVVCGTTGWFNRIGEVREACQAGEQALVYASNFSIGVNLFMAVNEYLAGLMKQQKQYNVIITETHHVHKLDKPSGTAISLAEGILQNIGRKNKWVSDDETGPDALQIRSVREGEVPGIHRIRYESDADVIELVHEAKSREGFAWGALHAAEWIQGKKGCFHFRDIIS